MTVQLYVIQLLAKQKSTIRQKAETEVNVMFNSEVAAPQETAKNPMAEAVETVTNQVSSEYVLARRAQDISLEDLSIDQSSTAFKTLMRNIVAPTVDKLWMDIRPLLDRHGGIAGTAQFAHCLFAQEIYQERRADFDALAKQSKRDVTLRDIWGLAHDHLKKYGIVFRSGWVEGTRSDHIKAV